MVIYAAPLQGYTTALWRRAHAGLCGGIDAYFTPFVRIESGKPAARALRDAAEDRTAIPQVIFRDIAELRTLCDSLADAGYKAIDLNMGCPFVPQVRHGRGAAVIADIPLLESVAKDISDRYAGISFSIKMRLGIDDPEQWRAAMPVINDMPLHHLCVHPRTAKMQYGGTADTDAFALITEATTHRVVYNGDIRTPEQAKTLSTRFPSLYGIMVGRGLLGRHTILRRIPNPDARQALLGICDSLFVRAPRTQGHIQSTYTRRIRVCRSIAAAIRREPTDTIRQRAASRNGCGPLLLFGYQPIAAISEQVLWWPSCPVHGYKDRWRDWLHVRLAYCSTPREHRSPLL